MLLFLQWVIPEMVGQCLSTMLMLVSMHWFIFLLNLPVAAWNIYRYRLSFENKGLAPFFLFVVVIGLQSSNLSLLGSGFVIFSLHPAAILKFVFWLFYSVFLPPGVCVCRYLKVPMGNMGVFDPTEIHNRGQLKSHMKEAMIKLGYHLLCFFIYLYR